MALSVSCKSLPNGSDKQTTDNSPNYSTARPIVDFINTIGQKRTLRLVQTMSALPPKADMVQHDRDVRFVPLADIVPNE